MDESGEMQNLRKYNSWGEYDYIKRFALYDVEQSGQLVLYGCEEPCDSYLFPMSDSALYCVRDNQLHLVLAGNECGGSARGDYVCFWRNEESGEVLLGVHGSAGGFGGNSSYGRMYDYTNGVLQPAPAVTAGPPLVVSGITVPAGGNATIIYEAQVNQFAPAALDSTIINTAVISGGGITPITVTETIGALSEPLLTITKSVSPVPVTENGRLTYTFLIQNTGNTAVVATDNAVITDIFDPILSDLAVSFNGTAWTEGPNYVYDETTGTFTTVAGNITVPAATYQQDPTTGAWIVNPGVSTLVISGTV